MLRMHYTLYCILKKNKPNLLHRGQFVNGHRPWLQGDKNSVLKDFQTRNRIPDVLFGTQRDEEGNAKIDQFNC